MPPRTLADVADLLGDLLADPAPAGSTDVRIERPATLDDADDSCLTFVTDRKHVRSLRTTRAAAALVEADLDAAGAACLLLRVTDVKAALRVVLAAFAPPRDRPEAGIHPSAVVAADATVGPEARVGPHVTVGSRTRLGERCVLHAGCVVGNDVTLGDDVEVFPRAVIHPGVRVGNRVVLQSGCVVGGDGFGYDWDGRAHQRVPHVGGVVVGDDVEIGACACVDRGKLGDTVIGPGTKIDNLVQLAHNVRTGAHCLVIAQAGIAGSTRLGNGVVLAGHVGVRDHVNLGDGVQVGAYSGVKDDLPGPGAYAGRPALPFREFTREQAAVRKLPELARRVRELERLVRALEPAGNQASPDVR